MDNRGKNNPNYKGGIWISNYGYKHILMPEHPRANKRGYVNEAIIIIEKSIGKSLPLGTIIHHINKDKLDNRPENFVVCQNQAYHLLLHVRERAFKATGNSNNRKCKYCKKWDSQDNLQSWQNGFYHRKCANKCVYDLKRRDK